MDFQSLKYIITVAESGGISKAAGKLFITEPSLSRSIRRTETQLGCALFARKHNGMEPTEAGKRYIDFAKHVLELEKETLFDMRNIVSDGRDRSISVGISSMWSSVLLPKILPIYYGDNPFGRLDIHNETSSALMPSLLQRKLDLAIITLPLDGEVDQNISYKELFPERILVAISTKNPLLNYCVAKKDSAYRYISPKYLADQKFILSNMNYRLYDSARIFFARENFLPHVIMREDSVHISKQMAARNLGVAFINESAAKTYAVNGEVEYCVTSDSLIDWEVAIAWRRTTSLDRIRPFIDATVQATRLEKSQPPIN